MLKALGERKKLELHSPVPHLLSCNSPPITDEEHALIQRAVDNASDLLKNHTDAGHIHTIMEYIRVHKGLLSPLRYLPAELLVEIFLQYLEVPIDPFFNSPPWILAHVCHYWRQVALGTAALWRHLPPIRLNHCDGPKEKRLFIYLEYLLQMSAGTLITFFLSNNSFSAEEVNRRIFGLLFDHCHRWERISFSVCYAVCRNLLQVPGRLTSLTNLTLDHLKWEIPRPIFIDAPKLKVFSVKAPWTERVHLPWAQLTSYHERCHHFGELRSVLAEARDLEKLDIEVKGSLQLPSIPLIRPTILPHLTSLAMRSDDPLSIGLALSELVLPSLTEVYLGQSYFSHNYTLLDDLVGMVKRSNCSLRRLSITTPYSYPLPYSLDSVLCVMPQLVMLDIDNINTGLVASLCQRSIFGGWVLVPQLETLTIRLNSSPLSLRNLARARCDLLDPYSKESKSDQFIITNCQGLRNLFCISPSPLNAFGDIGFVNRMGKKKGLMEKANRLLVDQLSHLKILGNKRETLTMVHLNQTMFLFGLLDKLTLDDRNIPHIYVSNLDPLSCKC